MPTGDMLKIGVTGLAAFQRTLGTIGHNISNVNTPGYSRQRTILTNNDPTPFGSGFVGNGVRLITTERLYNDHATNQVRSRSSSTEYFSVYQEFAAQIDNLLADPDAGLAPAVEDFFNSVQGVADDPTAIPAREVMMTQAQALVDRFHTMDDWFQEIRKGVNDRISNQVSAINALSSQIADMNQEIIVARGIGGGNEPNDLLDQRDTLVDQLAEHINITVLEQDDGSLNIFMGQGQSLVLGAHNRNLVARANPDDPLYYEVAYEDKFTSTLVPITDSLNGGDLGGIIAFRNEILLPAQNYLGWLTQGISRTFNDQHLQGVDLNNALGVDFFTEPDPDTMMYASVYNTGGAVLKMSTDATLTETYVVADSKPTDYQITYDGAAYVLLNLTSGAKTTLNPIVAPPPPANTIRFDPVDGMYLELDTTVAPLADDVWYIRATRDATRKFDLEFTDPNQIAAADPLRTWADVANQGTSANTGSARVSNFSLTDASLLNATVPFPMVVEFRDSLGLGGTADQYRINGGAWAAYGGSLNLNYTGTDGWAATISGSAQDGDQLFIDNNGALSGNQGEAEIAETTITDINLFRTYSATNTVKEYVMFRSNAGTDAYGSADEFSIDGGATWNAYNPNGTLIDFSATQGWTTTISGDAWEGDSFFITNNTAGSGDNRNARLLAELQLTGTMIGGNATYHEAYSELVTSVGNRTQQSEINGRAQEALLSQAKELREAISGVNLDEEAANLLKYQQAYAAAAQVIAAADSVFQTLLAAVRR